MPFKTSQSKVNTWRTCHYKYHLKYVEKIVPIAKSRPLKFGSIVHKLIEVNGEGNDWEPALAKIAEVDKKLFASEREAYGEIIADIRIIFSAYLEYWGDRRHHAKSLKFIKREGRLTELPFKIPIDNGNLLFKGIIDGLLRTPNRLTWLGEHKTFSRMPSHDHRWKSIQSAVYIRAIEMLGWLKNVDGVAWNYIYSKPPTRPQLLKAGGLSQKKIVTLPSVVQETLERNNLDSEKYIKLIDMANESRSTYFHRVFTPIKRPVVDFLFSGFIDTSREMADSHGRVKDMNIGRNCDWCNYESICSAILTGGDVDFVKERQFEDEDKQRQKEEVVTDHNVEAKVEAKVRRNRGKGAARKQTKRPSKLRIVWPKRDGEDDGSWDIS